MISKILYLIRFLIQIKFNKGIKSNGFVFVGRGVSLRLDKGGEIVFGKNVFLKDYTTIYSKEKSVIKIGSNTSTGHHTEISANAYIEIGADVIMGAYTYITDSNHGYANSQVPIRMQKMNVGKVIIESNVWIGRSSLILKDSHIGSTTVVAAGSVVNGCFDELSILGGVPAKKIKGIYE